MDWCAVSLIPLIRLRKYTDEINTTSNISVSDVDNPNTRLGVSTIQNDNPN